jgi:hypothetical protein
MSSNGTSITNSNGSFSNTNGTSSSNPMAGYTRQLGAEIAYNAPGRNRTGGSSSGNGSNGANGIGNGSSNGANGANGANGH